MKITSPDLTHERRVLIATLTDTDFLKQMRRTYDSSLMESDYAKIVSKWCLIYFDRTGKAPGRDIQHVYELEKSSLSSDDLRELIATFLGSLSQEFEGLGKVNTDYSTSIATAFFRLRKLAHLRDLLEAAISKRDVDAGESFISNYQRPHVPTVTGIRLFADTKAVETAFTDSLNSTLFKFPGLLHDLIGSIGRGDFLAFAAPYKTGKSFWVDFTARTAALQSCKVVFYGLEMTEKQLVRRGWRSMEGRPLYKKKAPVKVPYFDENGGVSYRELVIDGVMDSDVSVGKLQRSLRIQARGGDVLYRQFPPSNFSPNDLRADLDNLEYFEGFIPDVVVVDGADNMRCDNPKLDTRHKLDDIWMNLAAIRTERNIAMVTVSHVNRSKKKKGDAESTDLSEAGSKANHVTHLVILNQSDTEREQGIMRVGMQTVRDGATRTEPLVVLECRDLGKVCIDMKWAGDVRLG